VLWCDSLDIRRPTRHLSLALLALALGGFAIGTTEFVTMGLLPDIADGIGESIPTTGHIITAYALGVVVGAPVIVSLGARLPKRELAIGLILALGVGNAITAVASGYWPVMVARFVSGLPHGAYFGVASLLAASLVRPSAVPPIDKIPRRSWETDTDHRLQQGTSARERGSPGNLGTGSGSDLVGTNLGA